MNAWNLKQGKIYTFLYTNSNASKQRIGRLVKYEKDGYNSACTFKWGGRYKTFYVCYMDNIQKVGFFSLLLNFFLGHLSKRDI